MNAEKVVEVFEKYRGLMRQWLGPGYEPARCDVAARWEEDNQRYQIQHLLWCCDEGIKFAQGGRLEKAFRWLGFVQGVLVAWGDFSIEECGQHNMPAAEVAP